MKKLAAIVTVLALSSCGINTSPGTGSKVGQIVKLAKVGMVSETWEAELIRGGLTNGSGAVGSAPFDFTIEGDEAAALVGKFMHDQTEVEVNYRTEGLFAATRSESNGHFLVTIAPVKP